MINRIKKHWRKGAAGQLLLLLAIPALVLVFFNTPGSTQSPGQDSDGDLMSDAYESFFGLNPTNPADAGWNNDDDALANLAESAILTDPFAGDTDRDGFKDDADSNAISRAYIQWGSPKFTAGDLYDYAVPDWLLNAYKIGGEWLTNAPPASEPAWHVSAAESEGTGSLNVELDRAILTNNLVYRLRFFNHTNASLYMDLADTNAAVVAENLFGNLQGGSNAETTVFLNVPLANYAEAAVIHLRRGFGDITVYESLLYVDQDFDGLDAEQEMQLGTSDSVVDSDADGLTDYGEIFVYGTNPAKADTDGDGLTDGWEVAHGTNPLNADTDGDGLSDADEVRYGKDPLGSNVYARLPFVEGFEVSNNVVVGPIHGQHGWEVAPTNGEAYVQTHVVYEGEQALAISNEVDVRQLFVCTNQVVWASIAQQAGAGEEPTETEGWAAGWFFNDSGRLVVYDDLAGTNGAWVTLTNHAPVANEQWVWVAARLDYGTRLWNAYLNGAQVASNLGFSASAADHFTAMKLAGPSGYADDVVVSLIPLAGDEDTDGDGLPDWLEMKWFGTLAYGAGDDPDGDGLTNLQEYQNGTHPNNPDTDGDGYSDGIEVQWGTDPTSALSIPRAGISGAVSYAGPQTGPIYVVVSTNAGNSVLDTCVLSSPGDFVFTNLPALRTYWVKAWRDSNGNGSNDFWEARGDSVTNPLYLAADVTNADILLTDPDTDGDGYSDWLEVQWGTDPNSASSVPCRAISGMVSYGGQQTGLVHVVLTTNGVFSGIMTNQSFGAPSAYTFPNVPALRAYWIGAWRDSNGNGSNDWWEAQGGAVTNPVYLEVSVTNADIGLSDADTDVDGLPDWWELKWFGDLSAGAGDDPDGDGLTNLQEYEYGTDPNNVDTDGDGLSDADEVRYGKDPLGSNVYARLPFVEGFEVSNNVYVGAIHGQHGWEASPTNGAYVQTHVVYEGEQALAISNEVDVRQLYVCTNQVVWVSVAQRTDPVYGTPTCATGMTASWFFNGAGQLVVFDGLTGTNGAWVTLTNHAPVAGAQWVWVAARLDYGTRLWNAYLNESQVASNLGFSASAADHFTAMKLKGQSGYADDVVVSLMPLAGDEDTDEDGLPDWWEMKWLGTLAFGADDDPDGDGLTNLQEYQNGTNPNNPDTDRDGYSDGIEVQWGTDPVSALSIPRAGISGAVSYAGPQTGPIYVVVSTNAGSSALDTYVLSSPGDFAFTNLPALRTYWVKAWRDSNGNGSNDFWEAQGEASANPVDLAANVTNVNITLSDSDTDGDGYSDWLEVQWGTDPNSAASVPCRAISGMVSYGGQQTGLVHVVLTTNGVFSGIMTNQSFGAPSAYTFTNVPALRTYWIGAWRDSNGNGSNDWWEAQGWSVTNPVYLDVNVANADIGLSDADTDVDGLPDWWELKWFGNLSAGAGDDPDGDGLTNLQEYEYGTDPNNLDTDGDGLSDADEVQYGKDPSSSNVYARLPFVEGFEVSNNVVVGPIHGQHGWEASPVDGAYVQTNIVYEGEQALEITDEAEVRQLFVCSSQVVWASLAQQAGIGEAPPETEGWAAGWFFNDYGRLVVYDGLAGTNGAWVTLTNHAPFVSPQWVRVAARLDYGTRLWNAYLNESQVASSLGFSASAADHFTAMKLAGPSGYADDVKVSLMPLAGDEDTDGDGLPDWWEWKWFGTLAYGAGDDPDGDGKTNLEEYQLGTNPSEYNLWVVFDRMSEIVGWTTQGQYNAATRLATNSLHSNLIWSVQCIEGSEGAIASNGVFSFGESYGKYTITAQSGVHPLVSNSLDLTVVTFESLILAKTSGVPFVVRDKYGQVGENGDTLGVAQNTAGHADCNAILVWQPVSVSNMIWQIKSRIGDSSALAGWSETHGPFRNNVIAPLAWTDAAQITNREFTVCAGCDADGDGVLDTNEPQTALYLSVAKVNLNSIIMNGANSLSINETDPMKFPVLANGQSIGFTMATEPAGFENMIYWYAEGGNPEWGQGASFSTSWAVGGMKTVEVWFGDSLVGVITVVVANLASVSASSYSVEEGSSVDLTGTTDPEGYGQFISWSVGGSGVGRGSPRSWTPPGPGNYTVTGAMGSSETSITIDVYPRYSQEILVISFDKNPVYPAPDGDHEVVAHLNFPIAADWSFEGDALGCTLSPSNGTSTTITLGDGVGNLTVNAQSSWGGGVSCTLAIRDMKLSGVHVVPTPGESLPLISDGLSTVTLEADVYPPSKASHLVWSIVGESLGCALQGSGNRAVVHAGNISGSVRVRAYNTEDTTISAEIDIPISSGCGCGSGTCGLGSGDSVLKCVDLSVNLGRTADGKTAAGSLGFKEETATTNLATPRVLKCLAMPEVQVIQTNGAIRQVKATEGLLDVVTLNAFSYEIRAYEAAQVGGQQGGLYTTSGDPALIWRIANPDASTNNFNSLWISKIVPGKTNLSEFTWSQESQEYQAWELEQGGGLRSEMLAQEWNGALSDCTETRWIRNSADQVVSKSKQMFHVFPWGKELTTNVVDPDNAALTTSYTFFENAAEPGRYSCPKSTLNPDGSWAAYDYTSPMQPAQEISAWKDSAAGSEAQNAKSVVYSYTPVDASDNGSSHPYVARTETVNVLGTAVSKTYRAWYQNGQGEEVSIEERCASAGASYGAAGNQRTITTYYATNAAAAEAGQIKTIAYPDGRLDSYTYEAGSYASNTNPAQCAFSAGSGSARRKTIVHGTMNAPSGIANKTTLEVQVLDNGRLVLQETWIYTGSGAERIAWTVQTFDAFGHAAAVYRSNNAVSEAVWGCCGKESEIDENGTEFSYFYDALSRLEQTVKAGTNAADIYTTYTYDAAGNQLTLEQSAGGLSLVTSNQYDLAGRLVRTVDAVGLVTTYQYANGGRTITVTQPGGATQITENYLDGRVQSVTGTASPARYYDYGVNQDGSQWTIVYSVSDNSPVWEKTTTDMLGRTTKIEKPGYLTTEVTENFYNNLGQLVKTTTSGKPDTLYAYDEMGNQIQSGLDINSNGTLDLSGTDRITESGTSYAQYSDEWWQENVSRIYATDNSSTPTTNSVSRQRLTGFTGALISDLRSLDAFGNETVTTVAVDRDTKTVTQTTDVPDSSSNIVIVTVNGLVQSQTGKSGVTTTFAYDALGRRNSVTDARLGNSITHYDSHGWIDYVEDAAGNRTTFTYESSTGRKLSQTDPLTNVTYYSYLTSGALEKTWGNGIYPVKYVFDAYGRMTEMDTYRGGSGWDGSSWPESPGDADATHWTYQEATGLLTSKTDAAGKSVTYTYATGGKLATRTWARFRSGTTNEELRTDYSYNTAADLTAIDYSDSTPDVAFTYDRLGRQKTAESSVSSHSFSYEILNLQSEIVVRDGVTNTITRNYDGLGRPTGFTMGSEYQVAYGYDTFGRFSSVTSATSVVQYSYLPNSDLISGLTSDLGPLTSRSYEDHRNLLTQVKNQASTNIVSQFDYLNDAVGRRTQRIDTGATTNIFDYNPRSELTSAVMGSNNYGYSYDPIGNRVVATNNAETIHYTANELNQYTSITNGEERTLSYDADGNLTNDGRFAYAWDCENRLVAAEPIAPTNGSKKVEYSYDYMSRRVSRAVSSWDGSSWVSQSTNKFLFDNWNIIADLQSTASSLQTNFYVYGLDLSGTLGGAGGIGARLVMVRGPPDNDAIYFAYDANGNTTDLIPANSNTPSHFSYDPFGSLILATGPDSTNCPFLFSSKMFDDVTGKILYEYRPYDPILGRFGTKDPIGEEGGLNLYGFVGNNPSDYVDFLGDAYVARRPVHGIAKKIAPKIGYEPYHWQVFFEDGESPSDLGLFEDNRVRSDNPEYIKEYTSTVGFSDYEDCLMRLAVKKAIEKYGTTWRHNDNCQDFVTKVIIEYGKLSRSMGGYR